MTDKEAMKLALFALDIVKIHYTQSRHVNEAITALKERLAQPPQRTEQEPVAWMYEWDSRKHLTFTDQRFVEQAHPHFNKSTPLYTAPPKKQWVSLTDQEVWEAIDDVLEGGGWLDVARALEQAIKRKNA